MSTNATPVILAAHQPNYLPYLGYFHKMLESDLFVLLDTLEVSRGQKNSFANRNRIKTPNGPTFLTVPLRDHPDKGHKSSYLDVQFVNDQWRKKHLKTLMMNYKKAPHFQAIMALVEPLVNGAESFADLTIGLVRAFAAYLEAPAKILLLSELLEDYGQKTEMLAQVCEAAGANVYLSGKGGGKEYTDEALLNARGIELRFSRFEHPDYPQLWGDFEPNLSLLDLLFNCGPDSRAVLDSASRGV